MFHIYTCLLTTFTVAESSGFFEARDLIVGQTIEVGNRAMFIYDADNFTRKFTTGNCRLNKSINFLGI